MKALFAGGRNWGDTYILDVIILGLKQLCKFPKEDLVIIEGEARGLDRNASMVASRNNVIVEPYPVDHSLDGPWPAAGPRRNQRQLDNGKPNIGFAFHNDFRNSKGTLDMVERMLKAGKRVYLIQEMDLDKCKATRRWQRVRGNHQTGDKV